MNPRLRVRVLNECGDNDEENYDYEFSFVGQVKFIYINRIIQSQPIIQN